MSHPLTRWEKLVWIASWLAPIAGWAAFILIGLAIAWPQIRMSAETVAWMIGGCVLAALIAHAMVWHHGATTEHFSNEERKHLSRRLKRAGGHGHWRALMKKYQRTWYKGRSHSGERPRFD